MLEIQLVPQKTKRFFRAVIFLKDNGADADADVSLSFQTGGGKEIIFLPEAGGAPNYVYPESSSRFVHRIEKGIYLIHSRNKELFSAKKIVVNVLYGGKRINKTIQVG